MKRARSRSTTSTDGISTRLRQDIMDDEPYYCQFRYSSDIYYFCYIGELKGLGLGSYLARGVARQTDRPVACLAIVPDILGSYPCDNIIALSPLYRNQAQALGRQISFRTDAARFAAAVSSSTKVREIIQQILQGQDELPLFMFESLPEMTLDRIPGVVLIGPDKQLAHRLNNKRFQFELLHHHVPVVEFRCCDSRRELVRVSEALRSKWTDGIFVSRLYSAAGAASAITHNQEEIHARFGSEEGEFLLTRYLPHIHDPTVLAVVTGRDQVYVAGVADQRIEGGNRFVGSIWPSRLSSALQERLYQITREIGRIISRLGYRGIFGCDYVITENDEIFFVEINARKQGTTLEFCHALDRVLPQGTPSLMELEFASCRCCELACPPEPAPGLSPGFCWGTHNFKTSCSMQTCAALPCGEDEAEAFVRVAEGRTQRCTVFLEHVGPDRLVLPGTFLARTAVVARDYNLLHQELERARSLIAATARPCSQA